MRTSRPLASAGRAWKRSWTGYCIPPASLRIPGTAFLLRRTIASDNEPNAYVVFLTCLVGAVFSEDVWNWAHSRFLDSLSTKSTQEKKERTMAEAIEADSGAGGANKDPAPR
jgi:hypothetical protein